MYSLNKYVEVFTKVIGVKKAKALKKLALDIPDDEARLEWCDAIMHTMRTGAINHLYNSCIYKTTPVSIETFIEGEMYLGKKGTIYPEVMKAVKELNSGKYIEGVLTGGIGSGKTTIAQYTIAYQLYIISCLWNPHALFRLDSASEILFVFQSLHGGLAQTVEYNRFRALVETSYYFTQLYQFDTSLSSKLVFPNRVEVVAVSGEETAAIGQNVIGGIIDEVNYMKIVQDSKMSVDGGEYNQAWALYNSIARRRKTRFIVDGTFYGMLCLVSSKRFPGQFTDIKQQESMNQIGATGTTNIFNYDKRVWDIKPEGSYDRSTFFPMFIGSPNKQPRVLLEEDIPKLTKDEQEQYVMRIPAEYKVEFEQDAINSLREIAGVSTLASTPYLGLIEPLTNCFGRVKGVFNLPKIVQGVDKLKFFKNRFKVLQAPRYCHIDLATTGDSCGLTIGYVKGFKEFTRSKDQVELLPEIVIDGCLEIAPPPFGEILFSKVRNILYQLRAAGLPIKWVSFDSFQSVDSIQILRSKGFVTGQLSMDKTIMPYAILKSAMYDERVALDTYDRLLLELKALEYDTKKGKVDHTAISTKDVADSLAGVIYGLTMRREVWALHGINAQQIPESIKQESKSDETKKTSVKVKQDQAVV